MELKLTHCQTGELDLSFAAKQRIPNFIDTVQPSEIQAIFGWHLLSDQIQS